ncbi:trypsin-like peptidase domain-containing protein [Chitinophaga pollutisoli]|uniref:Trypsin-like peptidase domain-containing protein n=1 Tax=Chitinophaga pollutisoli TaxID=3133966 RepID=A0ABZ2YRZ4_9BACT
MILRQAGVFFSALMIYLHFIPVASAQERISTKTAVQQVIRKAGRASVKAFAFDTLKQVQTGGPFSAVVVTADGYLLTVAHASRPGKTYKISFPDGNSAIAVGMGRIDTNEQETLPDIGMMKIVTGGNWPFAEMGSSGNMMKGDPCMMIAYPESSGLPFPSIRYGLVTNPADEHHFLVTDCTMEVGDSGGPIFDMDGRVIGLNSRCQVSESLNHHVPVDEYRKYWSSLIQPKNYTRYPVPDSNWTVNLPQRHHPLPPAVTLEGKLGSAVTLTSSRNGQPASIAGTIWKSGKSGTWIISKLSALGDTIYLQTGKRKSTRLLIAARNLENDLVLLKTVKRRVRAAGVEHAERHAGEPELGGFLYTPLASGQQKRGVTSTPAFDMPPRLSSGYFGAKLGEMEDMTGVAFTDPQGPAARAGILAGDKLLRINDAQPASGEAFIRELQKYHPHQTITVSLRRGDSLLTRPVTLAERMDPPSKHPAEMYEGGKSRRRDGFTKVWFCDMHARSSDCGAPVYDDQGRFSGIVIARFSRTATVVLHASEIDRWMANLQL